MAVPAAVATGVLIDVDHVLDFYYYFAKKDTRRLFLIFHAWEYTIIALALTIGAWQNPVLVAGGLGLLGHLVGDQIANRPAHPLTYSLVFRVYTRFDRTIMFPETPTTLSETLHHNIPLWRLIEPRLIGIARRFRSKIH